MVSPTAAALAARCTFGRRGVALVGRLRQPPLAFFADETTAIMDRHNHNRRSITSSRALLKSSSARGAVASPVTNNWSLRDLRQSLQQLKERPPRTATTIEVPPSSVTADSPRRWSSLAAASTSETSTATTSTTTSTTPSFVALLTDDPQLFADISPHDLQILASRRPTALSLADMYKYGRGTDLPQRIRNSQFLYRELPIRLAQRAVDLLTLPYGLSQMQPIREVASIYLQYLVHLQKAEFPTNVATEEAFTELLQRMILDRTSIPVRIAAAVKAWRHEFPAQAAEHGEELEQALYRFFTARVGLRFLTEHHVLSSSRSEVRQALRAVTNLVPPTTTQGASNSDSNDNDHVELGCIQTNCNVVQEVRKVAELVRRQTIEYYSTGLEHPPHLSDTDKNNVVLEYLCPQINIVDCNPRNNDDKSNYFTYVPHHLHYMMAELLKNSVRATIRQHHDSLNPLPPIRVIIAKGDEDVTIKVCDHGGGIPRSRMQTIWKFDHSTASEKELDSDFGTDAVSGARMQGFGLPLARIYAQYFGGELTLKSTEGYGLDAYLYLPRLGDACENLPMRVRDSPGEGDSMPRHHTGSSHHHHK